MMVVRRLLLWGGTAVLLMGITLIIAQALGPELLARLNERERS